MAPPDVQAFRGLTERRNSGREWSIAAPMSIFAFAVVHYLWLVGAAWMVTLTIRARMAWPDPPRPMSRVHVVTATMNFAALAFLGIYLAAPEL